MIAKLYSSNMYSFKYEIGLTSTDIDFIDTDNSGANCEASVISGYDGRSHVLRLSDLSAPNALDIYHEGFNINTTGAIEFLFRDVIVSNGADMDIYLYDGATQLIKFFWDMSGYNLYYDNGGGNTLIYNGGSSAWRIISIRIDVDAGVNGQFDCYVYDANYSELANVTGIEFDNNATTIDKLRFNTSGDVSGTNYYIDCVGITAEGGYTLGDIQYAETDISTYMFDTRIHGGIIPLKKMFYFKCHPNDQGYFNETDFIDIFDDSDNLEFAGMIISKKQTKKGIYEFTCKGIANEIFERSLSTTFTTNNTKEKLQYITTNSTEFCFEGTYDATTTDWSYEYTRKLVYMFWLARFMERQVAYIEPDGEVYIKDYDGLTKSLQYYPGTYNFRDETVGTTGTTIEFVDWATDGTEVSIIASSGNHKNVLQNADVGGSNTVRNSFSDQSAGTVELWFRSADVTARTNIRLTDDGTIVVYLRMDASELKYYIGAVKTATGLTMVNNTWYHIKLQFYADNTYDYWIDGTQYADGVAVNNNQVDGIDSIDLMTYVHTDYFDAFGYSWDTAYTVGDNEAAWSLNKTTQNVQLIDSKMLGKFTKGYSINTLNITRATVRYKDNATSTKPTTPPETFLKKALNDFVDPKIQTSTEADQLAQNLYDIFSATTQFLTIRVNGEGWLQPGETLHIQNMGRPTIAKADFLIISVVYDPMHDTYTKMLLSDNIVTLKEYEEEFDTSSQQIHTASTQALENQGNIGGSSNTYLEYDDDDLAVWDIDEGDLTIDSAWHEIDLDGFKTVPSDAIGFWARVRVEDANTQFSFQFRSTSQANSHQISRANTVVANEVNDVVIPIPLDSNHKFDYYVTNGMDTARITVLWWIRQPGM